MEFTRCILVKWTCVSPAAPWVEDAVSSGSGDPCWKGSVRLPSPSVPPASPAGVEWPVALPSRVDRLALLDSELQKQHGAGSQLCAVSFDYCLFLTFPSEEHNIELIVFSSSAMPKAGPSGSVRIPETPAKCRPSAGRRHTAARPGPQVALLTFSSWLLFLLRKRPTA